MNLIPAITKADKGHQSASMPSILDGHPTQLMPHPHEEIAENQYLPRRTVMDHGEGN